MPKANAAVRVVSKEDAARVPVGLWIPKEHQTIMIELPGERLLAAVAKVVNPDTVICELGHNPLMAKFHRYEKGDFVPCERVVTQLETIWRAFKPAPRAEAIPPPKTRRRKRAA